MHHLLVPCAVADEVHVLSRLLLGPFLFPDGVALVVHGIDGRDVYAFCGTDVGEDRSLGYEVSDHDETSASYVERAEESPLDPVGEFSDAPFVSAELVVVEVVDDDVVRSRLALAETTW